MICFATCWVNQDATLFCFYCEATVATTNAFRFHSGGLTRHWEVLNGVGVDGVGRIFPFFYSFLRFSSLFFVFLRFSLILLEDRGKRLQFTAKMGNFTPTPSAPTPCKTSRTHAAEGEKQQDWQYHCGRKEKLLTRKPFLHVTSM